MNQYILLNLTPEEQAELDILDEKILDLQQNLQSHEDTMKLAELNEQRIRIIKRD